MRGQQQQKKEKQRRVVIKGHHLEIPGVSLVVESPHLVLGAGPASAERADTSLTSLSDERNNKLSLICKTGWEVRRSSRKGTVVSVASL